MEICKFRSEKLELIKCKYREARARTIKIIFSFTTIKNNVKNKTMMSQP